ncbi:DUF2312 domain-containing protein [Sphingomonas beigongshangi]|uniref:DUF2312 domain-containing protein n=1 Tax=Sphingomonas beigongshangi TaxID=2782540 RepID=UPI00193B83B8|nr:DUF2312 domain-containing protein [Sphingomonas beigongshangi]
MTDNSTADQLRLLVERVERLLEERKGLNDDIRDVFAEAKAVGFDAPAMKECIKLRAMDRDKRAEKEALVQTYGEQLGLF